MVRDVEEEIIKYPPVMNKVGDEISFKFCKRETWGARPPSGPGTPLTHPVSKVRFLDTKTPICRKYKDCFQILQNLQRVHMEEEKLSDIKYNFMVGGDGTIYEGRGWHVDSDRPPELAHLKGDCIDIAYIGDSAGKMITGDDVRRKGWHIDIDQPPQLTHLKSICINIAYIGDVQDDDAFQEDFPTPEAEQMAYAWSIHGQQDNNYVKPRFTVIQ